MDYLSQYMLKTILDLLYGREINKLDECVNSSLYNQLTNDWTNEQYSQVYFNKHEIRSYTYSNNSFQ